MNILLSRKPSSSRQDIGWLHFSHGLMYKVWSDYVAMRILYRLGRPTTTPTICVMMVDIVEKTLKLYLAIQRQSTTTLRDIRHNHGHNIETLRCACAEFHSVFNEVDVRDFTTHLNDKDGKLYQMLRYGSQETTSGFATNIGKLLPVVDKIFIQSILLLPEEHRKQLVCASPMKILLTRSDIDQSLYPEQTIEILSNGNAHFPLLMEYCQRLKQEEDSLVEKMHQHLMT